MGHGLVSPVGAEPVSDEDMNAEDEKVKGLEIVNGCAE
jgi:hypothetical protein